MKKQRITLIAILVMLLCATMLFAACEEDDGGSNEGEGGNAESPSQGNDGGTTESVTPSQGLVYQLSESGAFYMVTGLGTCTDENLIIPSTYENKPVIIIYGSAFEYCSSITSKIQL